MYLSTWWTLLGGHCLVDYCDLEAEMGACVCGFQGLLRPRNAGPGIDLRRQWTIWSLMMTEH